MVPPCSTPGRLAILHKKKTLFTPAGQAKETVIRILRFITCTQNTFVSHYTLQRWNPPGFGFYIHLSEQVDPFLQLSQPQELQENPLSLLIME